MKFGGSLKKRRKNKMKKKEKIKLQQQQNNEKTINVEDSRFTDFK